jgi:hypothetical protein
MIQVHSPVVRGRSMKDKIGDLAKGYVIIQISRSAVTGHRLMALSVFQTVGILITIR